MDAEKKENLVMAATREDIEGWFKHGVNIGSRYLVVICDTYDYTDYPEYFPNEKDAIAKMRYPGELQKVMECYDLQADRETQMNAPRAMALTV